MSSIKIEIRTDNSAFDNNQANEVKRILESVDFGDEEDRELRDINGNIVGKVVFYDDFDEDLDDDSDGTF